MSHTGPANATVDSEKFSRRRLLYADAKKELNLIGCSAALFAAPAASLLDCVDSISEHHSGGPLYGKSAAAQRAHNLYLKERGFSLPSAPQESQTVLPAAKKEERPAIDWHVGDQASHKKFGVGTVMEINGDSLTIQFANPEYGTKILKAGRAPIDKI